MAVRVHNQRNEESLEGTFALIESALEEYYEYYGYYPITTDDFDMAVERSKDLYNRLDKVPDSKRIITSFPDSQIGHVDGNSVFIDL